MCECCYRLKRQDAAYFGGLREVVLERDGHRCRVCHTPDGLRQGRVLVHHRMPGRSELELMISLCRGCHAKVHRTIAVLGEMSPLLRELWREQHPEGHEQESLDFTDRTASAEKVELPFDK
jgi:5-methylcytosine-specific restriction endonuclease McrA